MIQYKTLSQFQSDLATSWLVNLNLPANTQIPSGDPVLAIFQALSSQLVYLESLVNKAYLFARASTALGADFDSFVADFGFTRVAAVAATGTATFATLSAHAFDVYVPVGAIVQTTGGAIQFNVIADTANTNYFPGLGYKLAAGALSVNVTVQCATAGVIGNVTGGQINQLASAVPGIDTVTNTLAFINGADVESEPAARIRFINYINSLSKATKLAIQAAIGSVAAVLQYGLFENCGVGIPPTRLLGSFLVVATDGSGGQSAGLTSGNQAALFNAVDAVRAFTVAAAVEAPSVVTANAALSIRVAPGYVAATMQALATSTITSYINTLPIGAVLYLNKLVELVIDASPGIVSVQPGSATINGLQLDLSVLNYQIVRAGSVSVGTY